MNFPGATVIALNGAQSLALLSCLLLPLICVLVVLFLGNNRRQAGQGEPVPDWSIPAIDAQASGRSLFHTWAPAVKIAALLATSFLLVSLNSLTWALAALVLCALAVQLTGMPWTRPLKRLAALAGFLGMLVVILPLTSPVHPGDTIVLLPWLDSWPINLAGVFLALTIVCKAAAVALLMEPMLATAPLARTL
ncbi:MAG: cobalt ECF transporter T component CbiQ, partial [Desulfobulbus sp.]